MKKMLLIAGAFIGSLAVAVVSAASANANTRQSQCLNAPNVVLKSPQQSRPTKIAACSFVCCQWGGATGQVCVRRCMSC
jgi:hypothetical protein